MSAAPASQMAAARNVRVLIVDDSASVRMGLKEIITDAPDLEVMAMAGDPFAAADKIRREMPDVIILDIEMPKMDGLSFLRRIMSQRPIPVVICSTLTQRGSDIAMEAMRAGAAEVIAKPKLGSPELIEQARPTICDALRAAARVRIGTGAGAGGGASFAPAPIESKNSADVILPPLSEAQLAKISRTAPRTETILCIGSSTGGPAAVEKVLSEVPSNGPPVVVVQHMPEGFTSAFARRLNQVCSIEVREARQGDRMQKGVALIAPGGDRHLTLQRVGADYVVELVKGASVSRHRPSVDVMFRSVAMAAGPNAIGAILTGMGDDGAAGLSELRRAGGFTVGQDEKTSIVYGMPKAAAAMNALDKVAPLQGVAREMLAAVQRRSGARR